MLEKTSVKPPIAGQLERPFIEEEDFNFTSESKNPSDFNSFMKQF